MAVDKLVDSTQLNSDLTSVANAIRTKGGTSTQLAFPSGFVSAINAIPSVGSATISATSPINVSITVAGNMTVLTQYGKCTQNITSNSGDILCNNGVLQSGISITLPMDRINAYIDASGTWKASSDSYSMCVEVEVGKTYAIRWMNTISTEVGTIFRYGFSDTSTASGQTLTQFSRTSPQSVPYVALTADKQYLVIQVSSVYGADIIANGYITMEESYMHIEGTPEVLTVSDGVTTQTATIAPLLSVGNYRDEQDIINGVVTRRVTYCIYDGTQNIGDIYMSSTGGKDLGAVIVYPLATATTETVTAQPFYLSAGENSIDVTSAIEQAELKVKLL